MFSCCDKYIECSKEEFCIHTDKTLIEECLYKKKLDKGINFYKEQKYNDKTFIVIEDRMFLIGRRSSSKSYTYDFLEEEKEEIREIFQKKDIKIYPQINFNLCKNDVTSSNNRACCIVIINTNDKSYNITNFNSRAVTQDTALRVRDFFRKKNIISSVQYLSKKTEENTEEVKKVKEKATEEQLSMFDYF